MCDVDTADFIVVLNNLAASEGAREITAIKRDPIFIENRCLRTRWKFLYNPQAKQSQQCRLPAPGMPALSPEWNHWEGRVLGRCHLQTRRHLSTRRSVRHTSSSALHIYMTFQSSPSCKPARKSRRSSVRRSTRLPAKQNSALPLVGGS